MRASLPLLALLLVALAPTAPAEEDLVVVSGGGTMQCIFYRAGPDRFACPPNDSSERSFAVHYEGPNGGTAHALTAPGEDQSPVSYEAIVTVTQLEGALQLDIVGTDAARPWSCRGAGAEGGLVPLACRLPDDALQLRRIPGTGYTTTPGTGSADVCRRTCQQVD